MNKKPFSTKIASTLLISGMLSGFIIPPLNSQSASTELGILAGSNYSKIKSEQPDDPSQTSFSSWMGLKAGIVADFGLTRHLSVRLEPMFLQKGNNRMYEFFDPHEMVIKEKLQLSYVELPVLVRWNILTGKFRPFLLAGAEAGYLLDARQEFSLNGIKETIQAKENYQNFDYGVSYGAGVTIHLGKVNLFLEGRRSLGFANIGQRDLHTTKTEGWQLMGGVTFPLKQAPALMADCNCKELKIPKGVFNVPNPAVVAGAAQITVNIAVLYNLLCGRGTHPNECEGTISWERTGALAGDFADPKAIEMVNKGETTVNEICGKKKNPDNRVVFAYQISLPGKARPVNGTLHFQVTSDCQGLISNGPVSKLVIDTNKRGNIDFGASDIDGDGLTGAEEINKGSSDEYWDTDGDGVSDKDDKFPRNKRKN